MPRRKRHPPNWPYRFAWLAILGSIGAYIVFGTLVAGISYRNHWQRDWSIAIVTKCLDATFAVWFVAVGASIGSFLNVVAYRLPLRRTLGGHSACPFCCTQIRGVDNVPVLAWFRLRGRCRTCHLPISPQYPLVELSVALVFLFVYLTEFSIAGDNLPGTASGRQGFGFVWTNISQRIVLRTMLHLFIVSGLIGAALIAVHRQSVPLKLYAWLISVLCLAVAAMPELIVVPWCNGNRSMSGIDLRLDGLLTVVCGLVAGVALARVLAPLLFGQIDQKLIGADSATVGARQWIGALGVAGASVGWQAVIFVAWLALIFQLASLLIGRKVAKTLNFADPTVWVWCGLLIMRANWRSLTSFELPGDNSTLVVAYLAAIGLLAPVCWSIHKIDISTANTGVEKSLPNGDGQHVESTEISDLSGRDANITIQKNT